MVEALGIASKLRIVNDSKFGTDEGTDSLITEHASWRVPQSPRILAQLPKSAPPFISTKSQSALPSRSSASTLIPAIFSAAGAEHSQDLQDKKLLRIDALATSPPTEKLTHPQRKVQVAREGCEQALRHCFDISDTARRLPLRHLQNPIKVEGVPGWLTVYPINLSRTALSKESVVRIIDNIRHQLKHIGLLNMTGHTRRKLHQYYLLDAQYCTTTKNECTGSNAGQPTKRWKYVHHEPRRHNALNQVLKRRMFHGVSGILCKDLNSRMASERNPFNSCHPPRVPM